eukprot:TRINITY_DN56167_c0_g1_i1.p1 TRINITY_DN56167_c0_g1~~TRINITY_DN56167_c0_g1_i1.p1  ORF type:complete len:348 (+),score=83.55 TRINITY_DN56167_c0_g1_i1:75-1046(+)
MTSLDTSLVLGLCILFIHACLSGRLRFWVGVSLTGIIINILPRVTACPFFVTGEDDYYVSIGHFKLYITRGLMWPLSVYTAHATTTLVPAGGWRCYFVMGGALHALNMMACMARVPTTFDHGRVLGRNPVLQPQPCDTHYDTLPAVLLWNSEHGGAYGGVIFHFCMGGGAVAAYGFAKCLQRTVAGDLLRGTMGLLCGIMPVIMYNWAAGADSLAVDNKYYRKRMPGWASFLVIAVFAIEIGLVVLSDLVKCARCGSSVCPGQQATFVNMARGSGVLPAVAVSMYHAGLLLSPQSAFDDSFVFAASSLLALTVHWVLLLLWIS